MLHRAFLVTFFDKINSVGLIVNFILNKALIINIFESNLFAN